MADKSGAYGANDTAVQESGAYNSNDRPADAPPAPKLGFFRKAGDLAAGFASGAIGATKAISDVAGAGNSVSSALDDAGKAVEGWLSPQAQADQQEQSAIMREAKGKGIYEGVKAGAKAFAVAPVQTAVGGMGSIVPIAAATLATGGGALPAAIAGGVAGAAMGAGTIKGSIYDDIKQRSLDGGATPADAEAAATKAQSYGGENTGNIAMGAGLGTLDALTGVTPIVGKMARQALGRPVLDQIAKGSARGIVARTALGAAGEVPLEAAQGGQEKYATNVAAQRAGFQAGTWDDVASNATLEGLAATGPGALFGIANKHAPAQPAPATDPQTAPGEAPPATPLTGAAPEAIPVQPAPEPVKPSEEMGLAPTSGPSLTNAAIQAVDSGAHTQQIEQAAQAAEAEAAGKPGKKAEPTLASAANVNPATGEIASAFDVREADRPKAQPGDIMDASGKPFTFTGVLAAAKAQGDGYAPFRLPGANAYVLRKTGAPDGPSVEVPGIPAADAGSRSADSSPGLASRIRPGAEDAGAVGAGRDGNKPGGAAVPPADAGNATAVNGEIAQTQPAQQGQAAINSVASQKKTGENGNVEDPAPPASAKPEPQANAAPAQAPADARPPTAAPAPGLPAAAAGSAAAVEAAGVDSKNQQPPEESKNVPQADQAQPGSARREEAPAAGLASAAADAKPAKQGALDRIAKGTVYFGNAIKATQFIHQNGLKDTHQVEQTKPGRFEVKAKDAESKQSSTSAPETPAAIKPIADGGELWTRSTATDRHAIATRAGLPSAGARIASTKPWAELPEATRAKLGAAMEGKAPETPASPTAQAPAATENVANPSRWQMAKHDAEKGLNDLFDGEPAYNLDAATDKMFRDVAEKHGVPVKTLRDQTEWRAAPFVEKDEPLIESIAKLRREAPQAAATQAAQPKAKAEQALQASTPAELTQAKADLADLKQRQAGARGVIRKNLTAQVARMEQAIAEREPAPVAQAVSADTFIKTPDGSTDFGEITPEMGKAMRRQAGKIRLQQGNKDFGLQHIESRHGAEIKSAGFESVQAFVADVAKNIDQLWKPGATSQLVAVRSAGNDRIMYVQLQAAKDDAGGFYTVNTAFPARTGFVANKKGWEVLWEGRAQPSQPAVSKQAPFVVSTQDADKATTIPSGQSKTSVAQARANGNLTTSAAEQRAAFAEAEKKRKAAGNRARQRAHEKNPLMAFLGKHGVTLAMRSDFAPGVYEQRKAMVQGYGPIFRRSGMQTDELAQRAVEDGFLTEPDAHKMEELIHQALAGKRIIAQYAEGVAEDEMEQAIAKRQQQEQDDAEHAESLQALSDAELPTFAEALDDDNIPWDVPGEKIAEGQDPWGDMDAAIPAAAGATEQEIAHEIGYRPGIAGKNDTGVADSQPPVASQAQRGAGEGIQAQGNDAASEGLNSSGDAAQTVIVQQDQNKHSLAQNEDFTAAKAQAQTLQQGKYVAIEIERGNLYGEPEPTRYGAWISNGDGTAEYVEKVFPASRERLTPADIAALHEQRGAQSATIQARMDKARAERLALIEARKLRQGASWQGAWAYVEGKKGRTTFSKSTITDINDDGFLTVQSVLPGSNRLYRFTVDAHSRLFDNYPTLDSLTAPTKADVLAQQERQDNSDALDQRKQIDRERDAADKQGGFLQSQAAPEQRSDNTGDMFGGPSVADVQRAANEKAKQGSASSGPDLFSEAQTDQAEGAGFVNEPTTDYNGNYETDLFGAALPANTGNNRPARSAGAGLRGDAQPAARGDTPAPAGEYLVNTHVATETHRLIGAGVVRTAAQAAQATAYLYKSAVERLDGIVTDKAGKVLAIVGGFKGATSQAAVYPATLMAEAIRVPGAAHIWFSHNHPSGSPALSRADQMLNRTMGDVFRGSGIKSMGLMAVTGDSYQHAFYHENPDEYYPEGGHITPGGKLVKVPVYERELSPSKVNRDPISDPNIAKAWAKRYYEQANEPGIMLLDSQNRVIGWLPITPEMRKPLRGGALSQIYRAISQSNAGAAILVHGGELSQKGDLPAHVTASQNIAAALKKIDVMPLDSINVKTGHSIAETGETVDRGPMFSRVKPVALSSSAFGGPKTAIALRVARALQFAKEAFAGMKVTNQSDEQDIIIPASGMKHAVSGQVSLPALVAMQKLDEVVRSARYTHSEADRKGRNTIKEVRFYDASVAVDGEPVTLRLVVRVAPDGARYYDHFEAKEKAPAGQSGKQVEPGSLQPFTEAVPAKPGDPIVSSTDEKGNGEGDAPFNRAQSSDASTAERNDSDARLVATDQLVDELKKNWTRAPEIVVARNMQDSRIPQRVRDYDDQLKSQGSDGEARGFIYGGKVYLLADQLKGPAQIAEVLFHEVLGHFGLRGAFGKSLDPILQQIGTMRRKDVLAKARVYGMVDKALDDDAAWKAMSESARLSAAEEVLAEMSQSTPNIGFVTRAVAAIRTWLRENMPGFKDLALTDAELIANYLLPARGFVTRQNETLEQSVDRAMTAAFSRGPTSDMRPVRGSDQARAAAREFLNKPLVNRETGIAATVSGMALGKMLSQSSVQRSISPQAHMMAVGNLDRLFEGAALRESRAPKKPEDAGTVENIHHFETTMPFDGNEVGVRIMAKAFSRADQGTRLYLVQAVEIKSAGVVGQDPEVSGKLRSEESTSQPPPDAGTSLSQDGSVRNGGFDPANPYIRFSRTQAATLTRKVTDKLNETFNHPGKLSWWHKSVGSMYDLAERNAPFKRVFDSAQGFINDVSYYATAAADMAPKILPKLEDLKDITKSPIPFADNRAISAPIFQGTLNWARDEAGKPALVEDLKKSAASLSAEQKGQRLLRSDKISENVLKMWQGLPIERYEANVNSSYESKMLKAGIVWTDAELAGQFKLTPAQIGLYREFHAAVGRSLDNAAKAKMLSIAGDDAADLKDMVMDAPDADGAGILLRDHFLALAKEQPERAESLIATSSLMMDQADTITALKQAGYAPLSRFGRYSVDVVTNGERQYFGLFESMAAANRMAATMKSEYGAENVSQGTMSQREFELFQGITPESLELFGNMLGLDATGDDAKDQAFQQYIALTKNNNSAMKRLLHRKGIAGYSEDVGRVLASFVYSNARQTSAALNLGELGKAVTEIPKSQGEVKDAAIKLADYVKNPQEEAQAMRGLLFAQYLGGSVASAFVNLTQPMAVSFPYLSQFGGARQSAAALIKAVKDMAGKGTVYEPDLATALTVAEDKGIVSPQEVHQLMAQARGTATLHGGDGTRVGDLQAKGQNAMTKLALGWGKLFGLAEQMNRRSTFIAAYRIAVAQKMADPSAFAAKAVNETQFVNNRGNKMAWGRGAVGATLMTFKSYAFNYLELLHRMATRNGPEGKKAAALMLGMLMLTAGAGGLPFEDDLIDLIDFFAQRLGYNFSAKQARQEFLENLFGKAGADFIDRGITGLPGSPIDVSGRMGMGNLIPATGLLLQKRDHTRDLQELAGPMGDMVSRMFQAGDQAINGDFKRAALSLAPKAIANLWQGASMADSGMYKDQKGYKVLDTTPLESAMKMIGFQPHSVSQIQESNFQHQKAKDFYNLHAQDIRARWAKGIFEKDAEQVQDARDMLAAWNEKNPDQRIVANMSAILKKAHEMAKSKDERVNDTAPKAMRAQFRRESAADRAALQ